MSKFVQSVVSACTKAILFSILILTTATCRANVSAYPPSLHTPNAQTYALVQAQVEQALERYDNASTRREQLSAGRAYAKALKRIGQSLHALEILHTLYKQLSANDNVNRNPLRHDAIAIVDYGLSLEQTVELWDDIENNKSWDYLQPTVAFKLAKLFTHVRDYDQANQFISIFEDRFSESPYQQDVEHLRNRMAARFELNQRAIGVLLPLSGRFKQYGQRALTAIKLALGPATRIQLIIKDTAGEGTVASAAVESLVLHDHVMAIIGPLFSKPSLAAARKAEELSVPLITLSYSQGLPELGPYIFRTALTIQAQAQALAQVAFDKMGLSRFAILYPQSHYGVTFMQAFWDAVDQHHGQIRGIESYPYRQTTFHKPIRQLVGRWHKESRPEYVEKVEELKEKELPPHRLRAAIKKLNKKMTPIIDFDAIVIPDSSRNIGLIAPALAFEDIITTRNKKALERIAKATGQEEITPVTLLGGSTWNSPNTLKNCEKYCENATFVDAFFVDNPSPKIRKFTERFHQGTGTAPQLSDALAYDSAAWLQQLLMQQQPESRDALRAALLHSPPFHGVTGTLQFDANGEINRSLLTLTIKNHKIRLKRRYHKPDTTHSRAP